MDLQRKANPVAMRPTHMRRRVWTLQRKTDPGCQLIQSFRGALARIVYLNPSRRKPLAAQMLRRFSEWQFAPLPKFFQVFWVRVRLGPGKISPVSRLS